MNKPLRKPSAESAITPSLSEAIAAYQRGDYSHVRMLTASILAAEPANAHAWNLECLAITKLATIDEALARFAEAVTHAADGAELWRNYGILQLRMNRAKEAEQCLQKSLQLAPGMDVTAWPLAALYLKQNRIEAAERVLKEGMAQNPTLAKYPLQLAEIMNMRGTRSRMGPLLATAITAARKSNDTVSLIAALSLLGGTLFQQGERLKALPFLHEAVLLGGNDNIRSVFCQCIGKIRFGGPNPALKPTLTRAFDEVWIRPADIMRVSANLLFHEAPFKHALQLALTPVEPAQLLNDPAFETIRNEPLLLSLMKATMVMDVPLELLLTQCRKALLLRYVAGGDIAPFLPFTAALAEQSFANEYAFDVSAEEKEALPKLAARLDDPIALMLLAAYHPLSRALDAASVLARQWPDVCAPVIARQIREPMEEETLRKSIACITPITDAVSEAVRNQYEENPYPRWVEAPRKEPNETLNSWLRNFFPHAPLPALPMAHPYRILVAGCGTGQQSVHAALRFADTKVLAIDLSLASLGYALRKTREFGITNIEYAQGDILELGALNQQFDMVECGGVLHHLGDPLAGWRVLTELTKPGGYQVIALYSEAARRDLEPVRAFAREQGFGTSEEELRRFRAAIFALPHDHPAASVTARRDFYSLSMLRDLVFHVQEHRFNPLQLADACSSLGLEFCGFSLPPESKQGFNAMFASAANECDLTQWHAYETAQPTTFVGMYQFLVRKLSE